MYVNMDLDVDVITYGYLWNTEGCLHLWSYRIYTSSQWVDWHCRQLLLLICAYKQKPCAGWK